MRQTAPAYTEGDLCHGIASAEMLRATSPVYEPWGRTKHGTTSAGVECTDGGLDELTVEPQGQVDIDVAERLDLGVLNYSLCKYTSATHARTYSRSIGLVPWEPNWARRLATPVLARESILVLLSILARAVECILRGLETAPPQPR